MGILSITPLNSKESISCQESIKAVIGKTIGKKVDPEVAAIRATNRNTNISILNICADTNFRANENTA